jgi:hypothetical protein
MSYSVVCPSCNKINPGSALYCENCKTSLNGAPRQENSSSNNEPKVESIGHAIWRLSRVPLIIYILASLGVVFVCYRFNLRTVIDFVNVFTYAAILLAILAWIVYNGSVDFFRSQKNPHNPMNRVMLNTFSERTNQFLEDYREGLSAASTLGISAVLCMITAVLIDVIAN